jgi:DNA-binding LytR/AlgR family response regulator
MNVLIIEDERHAAEKLRKLLVAVIPLINISGVLESVGKSVEWLMTHPSPDLIFMDIQLDDGICFEIFDSIKIQTPVIFTTAFDEYALRAFKVNSVDYLLKPIDKNQLNAAIEKYKLLYTERSYINPGLEKLLTQFSSSFKSRFFVRIGEHCKSVPVEEIKFFYIIERSTFMKTVTMNNYDLDYSLDQLQKLLDPAKFFRINRTHIINLHFVSDIITFSANRLKVNLKGEKEESDLIVSREKVPAFRQWLDR